MSAASPGMPELISAARAGDRSAMVRLLVAAQPDIRRYARVTCRQASDIDDAVQEALWLVYRRVGTLRVVTSFSAWLMMVVRRECQRIARRALGKTETIDSIADDARIAAWPMEDLRLDLAAAIQSLPEHYRDIIILRDIEECTVDEIALAQNLSREAIKARLHRARGLIREYLKD
jgi:RNA polymerase sigma factor (sigma-70 family)